MCVCMHVFICVLAFMGMRVLAFMGMRVVVLQSTVQVTRMESLLEKKDAEVARLMRRLRVSPTFYGFRWITLLMTQVSEPHASRPSRVVGVPEAYRSAQSNLVRAPSSTLPRPRSLVRAPSSALPPYGGVPSRRPRARIAA